MFEDLLVVLDGGVAGERIVGWIRRLCRTPGARVRLLVVREVEGTQWAGTRPVAFASQLEEAARLEGLTYLNGVAARLEGSGIQVSSEVRFGPPIGTILDVARESRAQLVALAASGDAGMRDALGRVARQLLHRSPIAVLVARARDQRAA